MIECNLVLGVLFGMSDVIGIDIQQCMNEKMHVNKHEREWGEADENGVIHYVKKICPYCNHSLSKNNNHGCDQNDYGINAQGVYTHLGTCTYCRECRGQELTSC